MSYIELTLLIAYCGLDCATCEARAATIHNVPLRLSITLQSEHDMR